MSYALFETLEGRHGDGTPLGDPHDVNTAMLSIRDHLERLLNARAGTVPHLADYGLPDLPPIYQDLPYALEQLTSAVQRTITRYEPRLDHLRLTASIGEVDGCVLAVEIVGMLSNGSFAHFDSYYLGNGRVHVRATAVKGGHHA